MSLYYNFFEASKRTPRLANRRPKDVSLGFTDVLDARDR